MNLIFYLIERIPIGLGDTGIYRPIGRCFLAKRFVDYLWVLLAAAGIVLIAPWTNNGINVLFALLAGSFGLLYRPGRKGFKNERRRLLQLECSLPY
jgi:inner membrane transporter RhtA